MRILLATDHYPPLIGGAEIQSRLLATRLHARGHDVEVATVWQQGLPVREDDGGVQVHRIRQLRTFPLVARSWRHHQPPFPDPVSVIGLRRIISRFKPDLVQSHGWFSYSCAAALLGTEIPLVITARDYAYSCPRRTLLYKGEVPCTGPRLGKCLACAPGQYGRVKGWSAALGVRASAPLLRRKVKAIHSISTYVQEIVRRDFLDERTHRSSNTVVHDVISSVPEDDPQAGSDVGDPELLNRLPLEPFLLFVGALRRVKGVEQLIAAYRQLTNPPPLVLIGTIERDSPPIPAGIHVLTDFPHDAVMAAWERCLFAVLPSVLPEPFGTVVCEAMSRGKPVIGTRPGGHSDMIIEGETGFLVPAGDVPALRDAMQRLIDDGALRQSMGQAGRVRAQLFTADLAIPRLEQLYSEILP
jgi:glycosyltransferase involved in cell wall biosynthesis